MASKFYARYVPPVASAKATDITPEVADIIDKLKKRKRDDADSPPKKDREVNVGDEDGKKKKRKKRGSDIGVMDVEATPEISESKEKKKAKKKDKKTKKTRTDIEVNDNENINAEEVTEYQQPGDEPIPQKLKDKKHSKKEKKSKLQSEDENSALSRHKSIRQKLDKVKVKASQPSTTEPEDETPPVDPKGLEPLPQPEQIKTPKLQNTLAASLPRWLASPMVVTPATTVPFNSMPGISPKLLARLEVLNLPNAFAVQSVVVPLLLKDVVGDVCISAATGSGKTLSYILPIVQSLSVRVITRLRAVVVVPTRELVSQVFSTTLLLTSGTGLKVGTAVGSKALAAEQGLLVDQDEDGDKGSKVDILITTPGRLVEHIRNTPGFCLEWVKWLVIDEADRLLAQSFQEWVDVVVGSIESAPKGQGLGGGMDGVLENLGIRVKKERAEVRKVVLSATMTRDVGKLAGLKLRRPTMVVVENAVKPADEDAKKVTSGDNENENDDDDMPDEVFSVPMELREYAIPVVNTEYKPLYLMCLLRDRSIKKGTLVFVKSNEGAARLSRLIDTVVERVEGLDKAGWITGLVTGEMEKKRREKVLRAFKKGEIHM